MGRRPASPPAKEPVQEPVKPVAKTSSTSKLDPRVAALGIKAGVKHVKADNPALFKKLEEAGLISGHVVAVIFHEVDG